MAAVLGAGASLAGLTGCQQELELDRAYFRCEADDECGADYRCGQHPDYGQVCVPEDGDGNVNNGTVTPLPEGAQLAHASEECDSERKHCAMVLPFQEARELTVQVTDGVGNPFAGAEVSFDLNRESAGAVSLEAQTVTTTADGTASVVLDSGTQAGLATLTATVGDGALPRRVSWAFAVGGEGSGAIFVAPTNGTESPIEQVRVTAVPDPEGSASCEELITTTLPPGVTAERREVDVRVDGSVPPVAFADLDVEVGHLIFVEGFAESGLRNIVGCQEAVAPTDGTGDGPLAVEMREQLPVFSLQDYQASYLWDFGPFAMGLYGEYVRALTRFPEDPSLALFGCIDSDASECAEYPADRGLIDLALRANGNPDVQQALLNHRGDLRELFASHVQQPVLNDGADSAKRVVGDALGTASMRGSVESLVYESFSWRGGTPISENLSGLFRGEFDFDAICDGDSTCAPELNELIGRLHAPFELQVLEGETLAIAGFSPTDKLFFSRYITVVFERVVFPELLADYGQGDTLAKLINEERWDCEAMAASVSEGEVDGSIVSNLCTWVGASLLPSLRSSASSFDEDLLMTLSSTDCTAGQPDYQSSSSWRESDAYPLPRFDALGEPTPCEWTWSVEHSTTGESAKLEGSFAAAIE
ncbi:invasin domain 3-containing protein [Persicimonas caeni]|nr:invasin domain 3-containing protein [Persicimonas caeni]